MSAEQAEVLYVCCQVTIPLRCESRYKQTSWQRGKFHFPLPGSKVLPQIVREVGSLTSSRYDALNQLRHVISLSLWELARMTAVFCEAMTFRAGVPLDASTLGCASAFTGTRFPGVRGHGPPEVCKSP